MIPALPRKESVKKDRVGLVTLHWALLALFVMWGCYWHQARFNSATPMSRLLLLRAVWMNGCLHIDDWASETPDIAKAAGHVYSDKAPGTAALALAPFVGASMWLKTRGVTVESPTGGLLTSWAACAFSQGVIAAIGAVALFAWLAQFVSQKTALLTVLALWLGSLPLPYATLLFSHAQIIGLLAVAVWAIDLAFEKKGDTQQGDSAMTLGVGPKRMALAGFCAGLALASEYTAGLAVVALGGYVAFWRRREAWLFVLGAIPPLLLIPAYSWATLGTPFALPYSYQASFPAMKEGLYAIKWPNLENLVRLTIGPTRGLVFWTPFLALALVGWYQMAIQRPKWLWLSYLLPVLHILVISGRTWDWQAGYTISARYMATILPFLALPCALGLQRFPRIGSVLAGISISMMTLATVTDACPDYSIYNPLTELHIRKLLQGEFSYSLGTLLFGLSPRASLALYCALLIGGIWWLWRQCSAESATRGPATKPHSTSHDPTSGQRHPASS